MDMKVAFLNGDLEWKIYMNQPKVFPWKVKVKSCVNLRSQNKLSNNGILSLMPLLHLLVINKK